MAKPRKEKQQTLEATLGRPRVRPPVKSPKVKKTQSKATSSSPAKSSPRVPPSSFMHSSNLGGFSQKRSVLPSIDSSSEATKEEEEEEEEEEEKEDDEEELPVRKSQHGVTPTPSRKRRMIVDSDEDDQPLASSPMKRRRLVRRNAASSPAKDGRTGVDEDGEDEPAPSSVRTERSKTRPLTKKEKARELLRRKRAGETIDEDLEQSSSEEEPAKAMYDTDSDNPALDKFEDDEEGVLQPQEDVEQDDHPTTKAKGKKQKQKAVDNNDGSNSDGSIDDFVVDDSDVPLGVPDDALLDIPLEFTAHSRKPLKEHFRDAIEWLVQFAINPEFDRTNALYRLAWRKLDDEVRGLAQSKFASAAWKNDFYMALRARPYFNSVEAPRVSAFDAPKCSACGRSGHPAKRVITLSGRPYYKDVAKLDRLLKPVEFESDSSELESESRDKNKGRNKDSHKDDDKDDDDDDDEGDEKDDAQDEEDDEDEDEDGNSIPKTTKEWQVGVVCNSNAETAHTLIHWKQSLLDWVDARLHRDGYMTPERLAKRMGPKKKDKLVDRILEQWTANGDVKALYQDFKGTIEQARNKPTTGRYR